MDYIKNRLKETSTWNGIIIFVGYIAMYFTPDNIDDIIKAAIAGLVGINTLLPNEIGAK